MIAERFDAGKELKMLLHIHMGARMPLNRVLVVIC